MSLDAVVLNGLVAAPVVLAALTVWAGRRRERAGVAVAAFGGLVVLAWSVWAVVLSTTALDGSHVDEAWVETLGIRWHLGLDGISAPLVLMSTVVFACALVALVRGGVVLALAGPGRVVGHRPARVVNLCHQGALRRLV